MARIRTVKPEFWSSPGQSVCKDPYARLLFIAMWNWADDHGRGTANARELAGFAFPWDEEISSADIRRMLGGIRRGFGVVFYEVEGRPYYYIPSWEKHQKIDKRSSPKYPGPEDGRPWDPDPTQPPDQPKRAHSENSTEPSAGSAETPPNPRRDPGAGTGEQGNRGTGEVLPPSASLRAERAALALVATPEPPAERTNPPTTTQALVAEWIEHCRKRPPGNVIGQVSKQIKTMLTEGTDPTDVRRGFAEWARKGLHPSTLPSVVNEVMNAGIGRTAPKPSTTDQRVAEGLALAAKFDAMEATA